jgi:hypothetical protein
MRCHRHSFWAGHLERKVLLARFGGYGRRLPVRRSQDFEPAMLGGLDDHRLFGIALGAGS